MIILIIARYACSNNCKIDKFCELQGYEPTLPIKDESEFSYSLFSCIFFRVLGRLYCLIHCLGIPCISLISSSVFPMSVLIPICQDMFLFQSLAYSLSCPVYTYYLTMKGDTRGGRTITKFPCPSHIFSSEPPQNSLPFKNIFLSVSNP